MRKRRSSRVVAGLLAFVLSAVLLTGCLGNGGVSGTGGATKSEAEETVLTLWAIANPTDAFHEPYLRAIRDFERANPGVTIKMETFENEAYKTKIRAAVAMNQLPDIFFTWGGGFSQSFVKSGKVLCLEPYYEEYESQLSRTVLENATYDGKLYGVTYCTPVSVVFYNKRLFEEAGAEIPRNFDEFIGVCNKLIDAEIIPIGNSAKETWVLAMIHDALILKAAGPDKIEHVVTDHTVNYNNPEFIRASRSFCALVEMGAFNPEAATLGNDEACETLFSGKAAMYVTGSWMAASLYEKSTVSDPEDFDCFPMPVVNSAYAKITDFMGGASDTLMVNAGSEHTDLAARAAFEISKSVSRYAYLRGAAIPAWTVDYETFEVNPITAKVAQYCVNATSFTLWFDTLMTSEVADRYLALLQEMYFGKMTPGEFADEMTRIIEEQE
ncbi:MAG: extracellular solute-binding protein [Lachnospiraceae bacterium]|nr:extracellular solute-binding protein [Lachnospiraceae bacterium]